MVLDMMSIGISLIIVDDEKDLALLAERLHINLEDLVSLPKMMNNLDRMYDVVFFDICRGPIEHAEKHMHAYNIRRGIVVNRGTKRCYGRDFDWMKLAIDKGITAAKPAPLNLCRELDQPGQEGICHLLPEEKDDPHAELGYARR